MLYTNTQDNRITATDGFFSACSAALRTIIVYALSMCVSLAVLSYRAVIGTIRLLLRYTTKIIFYSLLGLAFVSAVLVLCSLYVITLGTLHFP